MPRGLSKSKILSGLQCRKRLYLEVHRPELAQVDEHQQRLFAMGHDVGAVARKLHPGGVLIEHDRALSKAISETREMLGQAEQAPLFEATFSHDHVLIRADILKREADGLDLVEVKAATGIKEYYYPDCAVQAWVIERSGHPLDSIHLAHVDSSFIYEDEGNYQGLLKYADITDDVNAMKPEVGEWVKDCHAVLAGPEPDISVGDHCHRWFECPFLGYCSPEGPEYPVTELPNGGRVARELIAEGVQDIRAIPPGRLSSAKHIRVWTVVSSGEPFLDRQAARVIESLAYPRYYLDFETIAFAVPIWLGTRPYQQTPFQWSCHIEEANGEIRHAEFLDVSGEAPMRRFAETLLETLGNEGAVVVYNATFEKGVLGRLAHAFPDLAPALEAIIERVFDLLPLTRNCYYHPAMHGKWSLKAVLPTIAPDLDYQLLDEVKHGGEAQDAYLECIHPQTPVERKAELERHLKNYCALDTMAMVRIARFFANQ